MNVALSSQDQGLLQFLADLTIFQWINWWKIKLEDKPDYYVSYLGSPHGPLALLCWLWVFSLLMSYRICQDTNQSKKCSSSVPKLCLRKPHYNFVFPSNVSCFTGETAALLLFLDNQGSLKTQVTITDLLRWRFAFSPLCSLWAASQITVLSFKNKVVLGTNCTLKAISKRNLFHCLTK